ncbi:hypothetical protein D7X30_21055 [Corallococcus sp. AB011P]|nr:hypothetical protein D7X30_21055 [Corallococcus sp. AB011P]
MAYTKAVEQLGQAPSHRSHETPRGPSRLDDAQHLIGLLVLPATAAVRTLQQQQLIALLRHLAGRVAHPSKVYGTESLMPPTVSTRTLRPEATSTLWMWRSSGGSKRSRAVAMSDDVR